MPSFYDAIPVRNDKKICHLHLLLSLERMGNAVAVDELRLTYHIAFPQEGLEGAS